MTNDQLEPRTCDECGAVVKAVMGLPPDSNGYFQVDDGLCLDLTGHYSGFVDEFVLDETQPRWTVLCHDCSANLFRALPNLAKKHLQSGHPCNPPCCEFSWWIDQLCADTDGDPKYN